MSTKIRSVKRSESSHCTVLSTADKSNTDYITGKKTVWCANFTVRFQLTMIFAFLDIH